MTDHDPTDVAPGDDLVSAVLDGEATAAEIDRVGSDRELSARLDRFRALADSIGTAAEPPAGLADRVVAEALAHLAPAAGPAAPPVDELSKRRAARLQGVAPLLAAAAVVVLLAVGFVAVRNLDSESSDTASADLSTAGDANDDAARSDEQAEVESSGAESAAELTPEFEDSALSGADDPIVAADLAELEAAVRSRVDAIIAAAPSSSLPETASDASTTTVQAGPVCDARPTSRAVVGVGPTGSGELGGVPITFAVYDVEGDRLILIVTDADCTVIAELDL